MKKVTMQEARRANPARIAETELFRDLDAGALKSVMACAVETSARAGETLFHQGDDPDRLYLVTSGVVKLSQIAPNGAQHVLRLMSAGDVIGCVAVFNRFPYPVTASVAEDAVVVSWAEPQFRHLMEDHPALMTNALRTVGTRTQEFVARLGEVNGASAEQKVARAVLRLARQAGIKETAGVRVGMTRQDLADMTGITYFTISRVLSDWKRQELIEAGRHDIMIRNPHALLRLSDGD
ncbi:MAG: Crp/Fnr family transcriptional regulator [Rhizobiaceae bacterium]|nr:Crp/Fnr family transcriptional regulator [Rhizobiaceae bacterium]